jgi:hypothetical protein
MVCHKECARSESSHSPLSNTVLPHILYTVNVATVPLKTAGSFKLSLYFKTLQIAIKVQKYFSENIHVQFVLLNT